MTRARTILVATSLLLLSITLVPAVAADHEVHCVDDPVCYANCHVERLLLFINNEPHLPICYYDQS